MASNKQYPRSYRVADLLKEELALQISREFRNSELGLITITSLELSADLAHARVFVTVLQEDLVHSSVNILNEEASFLRHLLAKNLPLKGVPKLRFMYDPSCSTGDRLTRLIDSVVKES